MNDDTIKKLTIDETEYQVDQLPQHIQRMVNLYNDWNKEEQAMVAEHTKIKLAKTELSRQIINEVRKVVGEENKEESKEQSNEE